MSKVEYVETDYEVQDCIASLNRIRNLCRNRAEVNKFERALYTYLRATESAGERHGNDPAYRREHKIFAKAFEEAIAFLSGRDDAIVPGKRRKVKSK